MSKHDTPYAMRENQYDEKEAFVHNLIEKAIEILSHISLGKKKVIFESSVIIQGVDKY